MIGTILDVSLAVIALIAFIVGFVKGFVKQFTGLLGALITGIGSIVLVALLMPYIMPMELFQTFVGITTGWFGGEGYSVVVEDVDQLAAAFVQTGALRVLSGMSDKIFPIMINMGCTTIGQFLGLLVADAIVDFVLWLIIFIILKLVCNGIRTLLIKVSELPIIHSIDRILGAVWSLLFAYIIVIGVLLTAVEVIVIKFLPDSWENVLNIIAQSSVLTIAHDSNVLGSILAGLLGVELPSIAA